MKITQETNEFKPITIVLETREEAEQLEYVMGSFSRGKYPITDEIYDFLKEVL